jgi:hypothetical protein
MARSSGPKGLGRKCRARFLSPCRARRRGGRRWRVLRHDDLGSGAGAVWRMGRSQRLEINGLLSQYLSLNLQCARRYYMVWGKQGSKFRRGRSDERDLPQCQRGSVVAGLRS